MTQKAYCIILITFVGRIRTDRDQSNKPCLDFETNLIKEKDWNKGVTEKRKIWEQTALTAMSTVTSAS